MKRMIASKSAITKTMSIVIAAIVVIAAIAGAAYYYFSQGTPGTGATKIGYLLPSLYNPYFIPYIEGIRRAEAEINANMEHKIEVTILDGKEDPQIQSDQMRTFIAQKYAFVCMSSVHAEAILPVCRELKTAGIPLIEVDRDINDKSLRLFFVGGDDVKLGEMETNSWLEAMAASGKSQPWKVVIVLGLPGTTPCELRQEGVHNVLDPLVTAGKVQIVSEEVGNWRRDTALEKMEAILAANQIHGIITLNDDMALGSMQAVKNKGLTPGEDVIICSVDAIDDAVAEVKAGQIYSTTAKAPFLEGYWPIWCAYHILFDDYTPNTSWIQTPQFVVRPENADTFKAFVAVPKPLPDQWAIIP